MTEKILGALKAVAPSLLALAYVGVDVLLGAPLDAATLKPILYGLVGSLAVYLVPNIHTGGPVEDASGVKLPPSVS
jgi:hypothetical protein